MKLATLNSGGADGELVVVSRDLTRMLSAAGVAATLQAALENWDAVASVLQGLAARLEGGEGRPLRPEMLAAPLPRAWQWLDASAFPSHGQLMQTAFNLPPVETDRPLMYQGMSHEFLPATADVHFSDEADGIDFEGEFGVITGAVPMGTSASDALAYIRLCLMINDWSLRAIAPVEMKTGFGWVQAKPACALSPVAVTPDELGAIWAEGRIQAEMIAHLNGLVFGSVPATEMQFSFPELIAHAARTRSLPAGTIIGSGTVSSANYAKVGSACIAERRAIEIITDGKPSTPFMRNGDTIRLSTQDSGLFGEIYQKVRVP